MSLRIHGVLCATLLIAMPGRAENLTIQFASPVAAQSFQMKRSAFVFRALGCPANSKADVTASAHGKVEEQRRSLPLKVAPAAAPNVFGIFREWPNQGVWVVSITASCGSKTAGAIVATDAAGLVRESSTSLDHAPTESEIDAALKRGKKLEARID